MLYILYKDIAHSIATFPPDSIVSVTPLAIVRGPVTLAFSVDAIVTLLSIDCALVLNIPPCLKLPLFASGTVTLPSVRAR